MKAGIESLSGISLNQMQVHYNSSKPAQLHAMAYAQGTAIHVAPGQERHLPHEAWHVVQQAQGRVKPTLQMKGGVPVNDDAGLEHEADVMGARALGVSQLLQDHSTDPLAAGPSSAAGPIQRYVTLGREKTKWFHVFSGDSMKKLLTMEDYPKVYLAVVEYLGSIPAQAEPAFGLSPQNVAIWKGIHRYGREDYDRIAALLKDWIGSHIAPIASTTGLDDQANWKEFDNVEELALALAHEAHPEYRQNIAYEGMLAGAVNESPWIDAQMQSVLRKVNDYMATEASTYRWLVDPLERTLFGSYNWAGRVTSLFSLFKSTASTASTSSLISDTRASITDSIIFLHDLMERWSNSGAGSMAGKIHEMIGVADVLPSAQDNAFESTILDEDSSDFADPSGPRIATMRSTKVVSKEDREEVLFDIAIKRAIRAAEKSMEDINSISAIKVELLDKDLKEAAREKFTARLQVLEAKIESRKARTASEGFGQLSFNDNKTPSATVDARAQKGKDLPEHTLLAKVLKAKQAERAKEKLARVKEGQVDKSSKAKGRRNVGTRLEDNPDSLLARLFSAPITAGRSMTTARIMQLVETVGGTTQEKTAVAFALFAYWARTYNKGLTPVHTFHETMDVARNFGVPYKPFHYPRADKTGVIDFMDPQIFKAMSALAPEFDLLNQLHESSISVPLGLHSGQWLAFKHMLDQVPRVQHGPLQGVGRQPDHADSNNVFGAVESPSSAKETPSEKPPALSSPQSGRLEPSPELSLTSSPESSKKLLDVPKRLPFRGAQFPRIANAGGGDCLFYALEGRDLNPVEMLQIRQAVAAERNHMPEQQNINALNIANALVQTPGTRNRAVGLMEGRDRVPNNVYAAMQAIPGMYAGDDELIQYCRIRHVSVGVVAADGELSTFSAAGRQPIPYTPATREARLQHVLTSQDFALFQSPGHWERIRPGLQLAIRNAGPSLHLSSDIRLAFATLRLPLGDFAGLKKAYRHASLIFHPDKHSNEGALVVAKYTQAFQKVTAAKELLDHVEDDPTAKETVMRMLKESQGEQS